MKHLICRVRRLEIVAPYTARVGFDDGTEQTIDFLPVFAGEMYGPRRDLQLFNQVTIDHDADTLVWPNGADFDPATLHDWPRYEPDFVGMVKGWTHSVPEFPDCGNAKL